MSDNTNLTGLEIAVIGMAGRFPGANNIHELWNNLKNGVESVSFFTDAELEEAGISEEERMNPNYVKATGRLENHHCFDAEFFGYTPFEADIIDPQVRLFHETVWHALEDAAYDPHSYDGLIGLYAGATPNLKWELFTMVTGKTVQAGEFAASHLNKKDYLCAWVSYKLDLKGPSFFLYTACSTSLVSIHIACQAILSGECDMAVAGGVTVVRHTKTGYHYQEGMIHSPDGHCRAFDINSQGIIGGDGVACVVLKRLDDAVRDRDHIYAVVKGTCIDNDGIRKVGFTAPSVEGQARAIKTAQHMAEIDPETITYVEAHGTGTALGDPIEIEALKLAFNTSKRNYCGIGSIKTNFGHLDSAAGVSGFIKTVLSLKYKMIPPSLHFTKPNPKLGIEDSPFYVVSKLTPWKTEGYPLRAGVSSFGIGGTNAHAVLEEYIEPHRSDETISTLSPFYNLILLSAKIPSSLDRMTLNISNYFKENAHTPILDAAYTLQVGRKHFEYRRMAVCSSGQEAAEFLQTSGEGKFSDGLCSKENPPVFFMFSGQGSQYSQMGLHLYNSYSLFREEMDRCFQILKPLTSFDLKSIIFSQTPTEENSTPQIDQTHITQPALFVFQYALSKLLISWGIKPDAMIGHSIGEYTAACLAGVFSLEDAIKTVVLRGKMMQQMPPGDMLSVPLPEEQVTQMLPPTLSLAGINSPSLCVVSGPAPEIAAFTQQLKEKGFESRLLHTSHAFHSAMMDPVVPQFEAALKSVRMNPPTIPFISNLTGQWITPNEAVSPSYWAAHLRQAVRFARGIDEFLKEPNAILVEIGPGKSLSTFVQQHSDLKPYHFVTNLIRHPKETQSDDYYLMNRIGELWLHGKNPDWNSFYSSLNLEPRRVSIPPYSFEPVPYAIGADPFKLVQKMISGEYKPPTPRVALQKAPMDNWFYVPLWEPTPLPQVKNNESQSSATWLIFLDRCGVGAEFVTLLKEKGQLVITVEASGKFEKLSDDNFRIDPYWENDYDLLFNQIKDMKKIPRHIVHFWGVTHNTVTSSYVGYTKEIIDATSIWNKTENKFDLQEKPSDGEESVDFVYNAKKNKKKEAPPPPGTVTLGNIDLYLEMGLHSMLAIARAIGNQDIDDEIQIRVVTDSMRSVEPREFVSPGKATVIGAVQVIPLEYSNIKCSSVDIRLPETLDAIPQTIINQLYTECSHPVSPYSLEVAYRGEVRSKLTMVLRPIEAPLSDSSTLLLKENGVYMIIGGFGGMGFSIARYLAENYRASLLLLARSPFPPEEEWDEWIQNHDENDENSKRIKQLRDFQAKGAQVMVYKADVVDSTSVHLAVQRAEKRFGPINGVIHTAGVIDYGGIIQRRNRDVTERYINSKVRGTLVLDHIFRNKNLDFLALFSSVGDVLFKNKFGQVSYNAANQFMESFSEYKNAQKDNKTHTFAINWCDWLEVGMSMRSMQDYHKSDSKDGKEVDYGSYLFGAIPPKEGVEAFVRILNSHVPRVTISIYDLGVLLENQANPSSGQPKVYGGGGGKAGFGHLRPRPNLDTPYVEPTQKLEQDLVDIWKRFFGFDKIGILDDFYALGGDSLKMLTITNYIKKELNYNLSLGNMMMYPNIKELAAGIQELNLFEKLECVVRLNRGKNQRNIFILHPMHGLIYPYKELARLLENDFNVFGIQARGIMRRSPFPKTMEMLVIDYIHQIKQIQPEGPYIIAGYCFGDMAGYNLVRMLEDLGDTVETMIMIDEPAFLPDDILEFHRRKERMNRFKKSLKKAIPFRNKKEENSVHEFYNQTVEEIQKSLPDSKNQTEITADEAQELKAAANIKIQTMFNKYAQGPRHLKIRGIINAPILDISAIDSLFHVHIESVRKMTFDKVFLHEIPGDHASIFESPYVEKMAEIIINHFKTQKEVQ